MKISNYTELEEELYYYSSHDNAEYLTIRNDKIITEIEVYGDKVFLLKMSASDYIETVGTVNYKVAESHQMESILGTYYSQV
jgi:hypothetical protein